MQKHQADDGQVAGVSKTGPEACHFLDREGDDVEPWFLDAQPAELESGASQAHRPAVQVNLMEALRHLAGSLGELITDSAVGTGDAIVDCGGRRWRLLARLEAQIIEQRRWGEVGSGDFGGVMTTLPPAHKTQTGLLGNISKDMRTGKNICSSTTVSCVT